MKKVFSFLLCVQMIFIESGSVALAADELDTTEFELALSIDEESTDDPTLETRFLPLGQMLVSKKNNEGLTLACRAFDEKGRCSRFQFAYFANANDLNSHVWASPVFRVGNRFSELDQEAQLAKLRKWIRKKMSAPRLTGAQRGIIGFLTFWAGTFTFAMLQTGKTVRSDSIDWLGAFFLGGIMTIGLAGADRLDLFSPIFTGSSGAMIGTKTQDVGAMTENFLLQKTRVRDRVFRRIRQQVATHSTYNDSKWVARAALPQE